MSNAENRFHSIFADLLPFLVYEESSIVVLYGISKEPMHRLKAGFISRDEAKAWANKQVDCDGFTHYIVVDQKEKGEK